ncbi:unnamed protein product [Rotaria magnacalcarata]|uniref:Nuclear receptor domain-containing protein n=2 Tax=Rotaria magnacalcarata TaxID=392030 RepID=A0A816UX41_9BILA|nr:unnamed protein product [Rotaria magnacalcarata]
MSSSDKPNETDKTPIETTEKCQVCDGYAFINNYGALSCLACAAFFRRNASDHKKLQECQHDGHCDVNMATRKLCQTCRLAKCFTVGMKTYLIRRNYETVKKRKLNALEDKEATVLPVPQKFSLHQSRGNNDLDCHASDRSPTFNVTQVSDAFSPIAEIQRMIEVVRTSSSILQYNISETIQLVLSVCNGVKSFISLAPDFKILTLAKQHSLLQRTLVTILCGGSVGLLQESGIFDKDENELLFSRIYGTGVAQQANYIVQRLNCDSILIKLMLITVAFSTNCCMIDYHGNINQDSLLLGTFRLLGSQNAYIEILWRYSMHKYGFNHAVQIFSKLIKQILDIFSISMGMHKDNRIHQILLDDVVQQIEVCPASDDRTRLSFWRKQLWFL